MNKLICKHCGREIERGITTTIPYTHKNYPIYHCVLFRLPFGGDPTKAEPMLKQDYLNKYKECFLPSTGSQVTKQQK